MGCRGDGGGDFGIGGRNQLYAFCWAGGDAAAQVDLVAIIGRWVMRGGDHNSGIRLERADREGGQRGRVLRRQNQGLAAGRRDDLCGIALELRGAVAGIATNGYHWGVHVLFEPGDKPIGGADDYGAIHARLARAHGGAQACGAEGEGTGEGGGELVSIALFNPGHHLAGSVWIGVVLGPGAGVVIIHGGGLRHGLKLLEDLG